MSARRAALILVLVAVLAAVALAVRSCAVSPPLEPNASTVAEAPAEEAARRPARRRVREPGVAEPEASSDPSEPFDVELAQDQRGSPVERPVIPSCEFVITVSDPEGRRLPGVDVLVQSEAYGGGRGLLDLDGLANGVGASYFGVTDTSGVVRITAPLVSRMHFRATSDEWHGEARASQLTGPGPIELQLSVVPGFRLSGRVVHDDGAPVTDARVYIAVPLPGLAARQPHRLEVVGVDSEGRFRSAVHPVPETRIVECYVMASTIAGTSQRFPVVRGAMTGVELVVPRGGIVRGRCVDEQGSPLSGVRIRGIKPATGEITYTGPDGRFSMPVPGAGGGLVFFVKGRVQTGLQDLRGTPGGTEIGDVLIPRGGTLGGRLVDPEGNALAGARIWVVEPISEHAAATLDTGPQGDFRTDMVGPGTHYLFVRYRREGEPSGPLSSFRFDGYTAGTTDAVVVLAPATWATLEVRDPEDGEPLAFETGTFTLRRVDGRPYMAAHHVFETRGETRSEFPFQLPGPGTYDVELEVSTTGAVDRRRIVVGADPVERVVVTPR